jgi:hypothetical protein
MTQKVSGTAARWNIRVLSALREGMLAAPREVNDAILPRLWTLWHRDGDMAPPRAPLRFPQPHAQTATVLGNEFGAGSSCVAPKSRELKHYRRHRRILSLAGETLTFPHPSNEAVGRGLA